LTGDGRNLGINAVKSKLDKENKKERIPFSGILSF
jgi:hypothetical protein